MEILHWEAYEYPPKDRPRDWYLAVGIIAGAIVLSSIIFKNFLFAVVILIATFILLNFARKHPKLISYKIDRSGIIVGKTLYPFHSLEVFGIDETGEETKLIIKSESGFVPLISLPLGEMDPEVVRDFLSEHLREDNLTEPFAEKIMNFLGF